MGDLSNYGYTDTAPPLAEESAIAPTDSNAVVVAERTPVADDSDSLTKTTIGKMCEYIRAGAADPHVIGAAQFAAQRFGRSANNPFSNAWGVFWFLKHRVRRVLDEGNMFRVGEPGAWDMLIAPAVLLRMQNPSEDCDGFTMAAAAMLQALGVPQCIVTVACDPREPERWSHVFGMIQLPNGEWLPLDCSHGQVPGWMVPQSRISKWQTWDLNGNPIDVAMPARSHLRGYVGLGQCSSDPTDTSCLTDTSITDLSSYGISPGAIDTGGSVSFPWFVPGAATSTTSGPSSSSINWGSLLSSIIPTALTDATKVATVAELPAGASLTSSGNVIGSLGTSISNLMPLILLGLGAFLVLSLVENAGHK